LPEIGRMIILLLLYDIGLRRVRDATEARCAVDDCL
jgi:hypothetical protein